VYNLQQIQNNLTVSFLVDYIFRILFFKASWKADLYLYFGGMKSTDLKRFMYSLWLCPWPDEESRESFFSFLCLSFPICRI